MDEKFKPAKRVAGQKQDVWSIINEGAAASPKQPIGEE
jgi:kynurenine aminotransferase